MRCTPLRALGVDSNNRATGVWTGEASHSLIGTLVWGVQEQPSTGRVLRPHQWRNVQRPGPTPPRRPMNDLVRALVQDAQLPGQFSLRDTSSGVSAGDHDTENNETLIRRQAMGGKSFEDVRYTRCGGSRATHEGNLQALDNCLDQDQQSTRRRIVGRLPSKDAQKPVCPSSTTVGIGECDAQS